MWRCSTRGRESSPAMRSTPGTMPHNLIVAKDGIVWYSGNQNGMIGRLDPASKDIKRFPLPDKALGDPHTLVFDPKGDIWFTVQAGECGGEAQHRDRTVSSREDARTRDHVRTVSRSTRRAGPGSMNSAPTESAPWTR